MSFITKINVPTQLNYSGYGTGLSDQPSGICVITALCSVTRSWENLMPSLTVTGSPLGHDNSTTKGTFLAKV